MGKGTLLWVPSAPAHEWRGQGALPAVQGMVMSPSLGSRGGGRMWGCTGTVLAPGCAHPVSEPGEGVWGISGGAGAGGWGPELQLGRREGGTLRLCLGCSWGSPGAGGIIFPEISAAAPASVRIPQLRYSCHRGAASGQQHLAPIRLWWKEFGPT